MIIFAASRYLLLLLLIPFFFVAEAVLGRLRKKRVRALGDEALVEALMRERSRSKRWIRCVLYSLAFFFFVIGLARPQIGAKLKEHKIRGAEIVIALDVSNSMRAEDYSPNRLERAKLAISRLADRLKDDRIGLVIFAGTSFVQLPVTADYVSAKMFLNSISTASVPVQGTAIGDAIHTAAKSFSAQSEHSRAIILITDGENHEDDAVAAAKARSADILLVDTAGRLHNKKNLMNELHKLYRILEKEYPEAKRETLLVLDGTTGQNALMQAKEFSEAAEVTGVILTK